MNEAKGQFRSAAFGGFNRQDVLKYLESSGQDYEAKLASLRSELEKAKNEGAETAEKLEELVAENARNQEHAEKLARELDALRAEADVMQAELTEKKQALAAAEEDLCELRAQMAELEPAARAYALIKDRAATIELEAHERAQRALDEAGERAGQIQEKSAEQVRQVQDTFDRFRIDLEATLAHAAQEIGQVLQSFEIVTEELGGHDDAIRELIRQSEEKPGEM